jgi:hypothetical protein
VDPKELAEILSSPNALPREMVEFMLAHNWGTKHEGWHRIALRQVSGESRGWKAIQDADVLTRYGYHRSFLAMHRHMIEVLKTRFPNATEFDGWTKEEIERAVQTGVLEGVTLSAMYRKTLSTLSNIQTLALVERTSHEEKIFANSETFGDFIQDDLYDSERYGHHGFHDYMHGELSDENDPVDMRKFSRNLMNKLFWKLHGFIDRVWQEFMDAKGLSVPREVLDYQAEMMELLGDEQAAPGLERYRWLMPERPDWRGFSCSTEPFLDVEERGSINVMPFHRGSGDCE